MRWKLDFSYISIYGFLFSIHLPHNWQLLQFFYIFIFKIQYSIHDPIQSNTFMIYKLDPNSEIMVSELKQLVHTQPDLHTSESMPAEKT